jgi:hypothetical protein
LPAKKYSLLYLISTARGIAGSGIGFVASVPAEQSSTKEPTMTNPNHITETSGSRRGMARPALWVLLVLCAAANIVTSSTGIVLVGIAFGLLTLACAAALVVHHYRRRLR